MTNFIKQVNVRGTAYDLKATYDEDGNRIKDTYATKTEIEAKVDKIEGKTLSTNDYTNDEKTKLGSIAANAQVNIIESIKLNGAELTVTDKAVNIDISTKVDQTTVDALIERIATLESKVAALEGGSTES